MLWLLATAGVYVALFLLAKKGAGADERALKEEIAAQRAAQREELLAELNDPATLECLQNAHMPAEACSQKRYALSPPKIVCMPVNIEYATFSWYEELTSSFSSLGVVRKPHSTKSDGVGEHCKI